MKYRKETQENIYRKYKMRLFVDIRHHHILKYFKCHVWQQRRFNRSKKDKHCFKVIGKFIRFANLTVYLILTFCNFVLKYANTSSGMFQNLKCKFQARRVYFQASTKITFFQNKRHLPSDLRFCLRSMLKILFSFTFSNQLPIDGLVIY